MVAELGAARKEQDLLLKGFRCASKNGRPAAMTSMTTVGRALKGKPAMSSASLSGAVNSLKANGEQRGLVFNTSAPLCRHSSHISLFECRISRQSAPRQTPRNAGFSMAGILFAAFPE